MQTTAQPTQPATTAQAPTAVVVGQDLIPNAEYQYQAARALQRELRGQLETLVEQRHGFLREIEDHGAVGGPARTGMEQRIQVLDQRIAELDQHIATADLQVARAAAIPGAVVVNENPQPQMPAEEVMMMGLFMTGIVLLPLSVALARRIWRRGAAGAAAVAAIPRELIERLGRIEQLGEATAVEVERIGEGQRFVTRLLTEKDERVLSSGRP